MTDDDGSGAGEELRYRPVRLRSRAPLIAGVAVAIVGIAAIAMWLIALRPTSSATASSPVSSSPSTTDLTPRTTLTPRPPSRPTSTIRPTTTVLQTTTRPSTTVAVQPRPAGGTPSEAWVAMLGSLPSEADAAEERAKLESIAPGVRVARSDDVPSLVPGYWVVYVGPIASGEDALAYCRSIGRNHRDLCYASYFSNDPADRTRRIFPT